MKSILVTGGAGYVGFSVVRALAEKYPQSKIVISDNLSKGKLENIAPILDFYKNTRIVPWETADIRDGEKFEKILLEHKPEAVIHLAAIVDAFTTNREGKDAECHIVNNTAAVEIAKLCKKHGVKSFIYQSTVSMYSRGEELKEDSPKEPLSAYGIAKYEAEKSILALGNNNFRVCAIRSATLVGYNPSFRHETIINLLCLRSVYGIKTTIFESALKNPKSYLTLEDEAACIIFVLENMDRMKGEAYNLSSFNTDLQTVIDAIKKENAEPLVEIDKEKTINQQVYTINSDKIKKAGFAPKGNFSGVIKETINGIRFRKEANLKLNKLV